MDSTAVWFYITAASWANRALAVVHFPMIGVTLKDNCHLCRCVSLIAAAAVALIAAAAALIY